MNTSRFASVGARKFLNFFLLAVGVLQLSLTAFLASNYSPSFKSFVGFKTSAPVAIVSPAPVVPVAAAPAPVTKVATPPQPVVDTWLIERQKEIQQQAIVQAKIRAQRQAMRLKTRRALKMAQFEAESKMRREAFRKRAVASVSKNKRHAYRNPKAVYRKVARVAKKHASPRRVARVSPKRGIASSSSKEESLESVLGPDAIRASDEVIAENEGRIPREQLSIARELGIGDRDFRAIWRKEQLLKKKLRRADASGATGTRRILLADHQAWMRETLGQGKYERYMELAR